MLGAHPASLGSSGAEGVDLDEAADSRWYFCQYKQQRNA